MKTKNWSAFLAIAVFTLGIGLFISPHPALAKQGGFNNSNNEWKYNNSNNNNNGTAKPIASVPEPSTILLLGSGMAGLAIMRGRKWWKK